MRSREGAKVAGGMESGDRWTRGGGEEKSKGGDHKTFTTCI